MVNARTWSLGALDEALGRLAPDFLFVSPQVNPVGLLLAARGETRLVMASYDVEHVRMQRLAAAQRGVAALALRLEASRAPVRGGEPAPLRRRGRRQRPDRRHYVDDYGIPADRVLVVENGVDPDYFPFVERARRAPAGRLRREPALSAERPGGAALLRHVMPIVGVPAPGAGDRGGRRPAARAAVRGT